MAQRIPVNLRFRNTSTEENDFLLPSTTADQIEESTNKQFISQAEKEAIANKQDSLGFIPVNKNGDILTGPLILSNDAIVENRQAVTKSYVDSKVSAIVNSAPAALDTINELAAAIGNDPNFAVSVSSLVGGKLDKTSASVIAEANKLLYLDANKNLNANAATATKIKTPVTLTLTGDVTGSASIDGSQNVSLETSIPNLDSLLASGFFTLDENLDLMPGAYSSENGSIIIEDKIYDAMTAAELNAGTQTTPRVISPQLLASYVTSKVGSSGGSGGGSSIIITGTTNGTINVDGTDVAVYGLKSAAYATSESFLAADGTAAKATADANGNTITTTYATKSELNNKADSTVFVGSGSNAASGLVPAPSTTAGTTKYLREDGTWQVPPNDGTSVGSGIVLTGYEKAGSVSSISASDTVNSAIGKLEKALDSKQDSGSYLTASSNLDATKLTGTIPSNCYNDTTYNNFIGSGSTAASGLVPAPSTTAGTSKYLREDGTWAVPPDTDTTVGSAITLTGYEKASSEASISSSDSVNVAIGKLEKALDGKQSVGSYLTSSSNLDATKLTGTIPSNCYNDTTYTNFVGSGSSAASGLVPSPGSTAGTTKYLREDGNWEVPPGTSYTHPTTSGNKHIPSGGSSNQILRWSADGTAVWDNENNTTYSDFVGSGATAASGLVPKPSTTAGTTKYLREDGSWQVPPNSTVGSDIVLTGYSKASSESSLATTDTVNEALGKLEKALDGKQSTGSYLTSSSTLDATKLSGTIPAGCYNDTTYSDFTGSGLSASHGLVPIPPLTAGTSKYLCEDGSWSVPPDTNTTYSNFVGSGASAAAGLVPQPPSESGTAKYLREDGTWAIPPNSTASAASIGSDILLTGYIKPNSTSAIVATDNVNDAIGKLEKALDSSVTYTNFVGSGSNAAAGLVPSPGTTAGTSKYLREDGTWQVPPDNNTTYSTFVGSGSSAAAGLVPAPSTTAGTSKYLREDGSWTVPPNDNTTLGSGIILTGYSKASSVSAIAATDNVNEALGKLEKALDGKQASGSYLTSSSTLDATKLSGIIPAGCYTNTTYSNFTGSGSSASSGLVPAPSTTAGSSKYLCEDGTWKTPSGVQSITSGSSNGTISVDGTNVSVYGLGSAAYTASTDYAAASHGNHVPTVETANNAKFLRNDNSWQTVTPSNIGAAAATHNHASSDINALTSYNKSATGGTGALSTSDSLNIALAKLENAIDGKQTSGSYAASSHNHTKSDITDFPTIPTITDTYSSTSSDGMSGKAVASALSGLTASRIGAASSSHTHVGTEVTLTGYNKASSVAAIAATDTVSAALGKLEKALDGKQASGTYLTSASTLDATKLSGIIPSGCYTDTTYSDFVGSGSTAAAGLVPAPSTTAGTTKYLREDGSWQVPPNDNTTVGSGITLTGYTKPGSTSAIAATDTVNAAIGKLEKALEGKQVSGTYLTSSSTLDATKLSGIIPSGCYTNTTYSNFVGSGSTAAAGLVPAPSTTAGTTKYLREDGSWEVPAGTYTHPTTSGNKHIPSGGSSGQILKWSSDGTAVWANESSGGIGGSYSDFVGSGSSAAAGLVPAPSTTAGTTKYLCEDGTWSVPPNTTYSAFVGSGTNAEAGLVPKPSTTAGTTKFLREDGYWEVPPNTTYSIADSSNAGIVKLYSSSGNNTDGTMTQAAIASAITAAINAVGSASNMSF